MLKGLIEGACIARSHQPGAVVSAWPEDWLIPAVDPRGERDVEGDLNPRPGDFAAALGGMAVPELEKRAGYKDREVHGHALPKPPVIHVSAVRPGGCTGNCLPAIRRNPKASDHGIKRNLECR